MLRNEMVDAAYNIAINKNDIFLDNDSFKNLVMTCDSILNESRFN
jgi:hypothetical protein